MVRSFFAFGLSLSLLVAPVSGVEQHRNAARLTTDSPALQVQATDRHSPPVDAPIIDYFRPPTETWLAGNRGIEYDTQPGDTVRASAAGVVTFAGQVGGRLFVTIQHNIELLTTVGFVQEIRVSAGDRVVEGQPIAIAGESIHFTARQQGTYIDPLLLFGRVRVVVRLVESPT